MKMATVRKYALSLEAATQAPHFAYSSFRIRGRMFVTVPPGDAAIHVFVPEEARERALAMYPAWAEKLLWGGKVVGLRVTLAAAPAPAVKALIAQAYAARARSRR
jgi:hypothetical protein